MSPIFKERITCFYFFSLYGFRWILLLLVKVKHKEEFSQVFITKIEFLRRNNEDKDSKTQQDTTNMQKYHQVNTLALENYRGL